MARRSGPTRSKKPAARRGGSSGSNYGYSAKSPAKPPAKPASKADKRSASPPRPSGSKGKPRPTSKSRPRPSASQTAAKPRRGIIETRPDTRTRDALHQDTFEHIEPAGDASLGNAPARRGWDIHSGQGSRSGQGLHADPGLDADQEPATPEDFIGDDDDAAAADAEGGDFQSFSDVEDAPDHNDPYNDHNDPEADDPDDEPDAIQARQRVRLQRVLADAGVAARRHAESLIEEGRVTVNGDPVRDLPCFVDPHFDRIHVDGRPIPKPARHVYVMFHKPERVLVSDADEPGMDRKTLRDFVQHPAAPRLFAVGRLDFQTTGIVLLTNDGDLANRISHPRANLAKTYHVVVKGAPTPQNMRVFTRAAAAGDRAKAKLDPRAAIKLRSRPRAPLEVRVVTSDPSKSLLEITTRDERNLDIRGACLAAGLPVKKITRISYGPVRLTALPLGNWRELTRPEVNAIKKAARLAREGRASPPPANPGVDFSSLPAAKLAEPNAEPIANQAVGERKPPHRSTPSRPAPSRPAPPRGTSSMKPAPRSLQKSPAAAPPRAPKPSPKPPLDPAPRPSSFRPRVIS